jgi:hypothetical protein
LIYSISTNRPFQATFGIFREEAIMLLRRFYIQENEKAPEPKQKKTRELKTDIIPLEIANKELIEELERKKKGEDCGLAPAAPAALAPLSGNAIKSPGNAMAPSPVSEVPRVAGPIPTAPAASRNTTSNRMYTLIPNAGGPTTPGATHSVAIPLAPRSKPKDAAGNGRGGADRTADKKDTGRME